MRANKLETTLSRGRLYSLSGPHQIYTFFFHVVLVFLCSSQLRVSHNKMTADTASLHITMLTVLGSFGSVVFTDLPAGPTRVRAIGKGANRMKQMSEWFTVTV